MAKRGKLKWVVEKWKGKNMRSELQEVYVGKSRRRYLVTSDVVEHPLFRELVERSRSRQDQDVNDTTITVSCEVVLFQHLLWMLQNAHPPDSLNDLVDFYAS